MSRKGLEELVVKGDKRAFGIFFRREKRGLLGYLEGRIGSRQDAEELLQDTFLSLLDSLPLFRFRSSLKTFLYSIARHEVADYWRRRYAKRVIKTVPFADQVYVERLYSSIKTTREVERTFVRLTAEQRRILQLKYEEGLSVKEIASRIGVSVKAAESRLFRARKAFQLAYLEVTEG